MTDVAALVVDNLAIWTGATERRSGAGRGGGKRLNLYGIERLRALILDLAVRGRLVPQDSQDEPASEFLKRISKEKARLLKAAEIKKEKPLDPITVENQPFNLPQNWSWVRLDSLSRLITKGSSPKWQGVNYVNADEGILFITSENVGNHELRKLDELKYVESRFRDIEPRSMLRRGDILMNLVGASIGRAAIYNLDAEANINQAVALIRLVEISDGPLVRYLLQYLNSSTAIEFMLGSRVITAQPNMSLTDSREFPIPLPPLAEQHRIVAKVDELMALCDGLEEESAAALEAHQRLAECLLATLVDSSDASNLASNWSRFEVHFDTLFSTEESIDALKRTVLELAVRGKLVPQDPQDEPASDLLKRIAKEKARLFKVGEGRKEKPLLPVDEEANFDIPPTWEWTRLGIVTSYIQRGKSPKYATENGSLVVSQKCIQWRGLDLSVSKQITIDSLFDYEGIRFLRDGDLLWNSTGTGTIGRVIRLVDPPEKLVCDSHVTVVRCLMVQPEYIRIWLRSHHVYGVIEDRAAGSTNQVELTAQMAFNQVVPLPPLAEQYRIVAKVDALMALCDSLKASLAEASETQKHLADAIVEKAAA